jgi:uncharacterized membrane protein
MAQMSFRSMSWNLKFFGNYNYSSTKGWMAQSIIDAQADVVVILEVFNTRSNGNIGSYMTTLNAQIAVKELCSTVNTKDKPSTWTYEISGGNAG